MSVQFTLLALIYGDNKMRMRRTKEFKSFDIEDGCYNCHGCGTSFALKGFQLPELCNQPLVLCKYCQELLKKSIEVIKNDTWY